MRDKKGVPRQTTGIFMFTCRIHDEDLLPVTTQVESIEDADVHPIPLREARIKRIQRNLNRDFIRATVSTRDYIDLSRRLTQLLER